MSGGYLATCVMCGCRDAEDAGAFVYMDDQRVWFCIECTESTGGI